MKIKLGNFGNGRFVRNEIELRKTLFLKNVNYMSPEMIKSPATNGYAIKDCDIWQFGVLGYALIFGKLPFDDEEQAIIKEGILTVDLEFDSKRIPDVAHNRNSPLFVQMVPSPNVDPLEGSPIRERSRVSLQDSNVTLVGRN